MCLGLSPEKSSFASAHRQATNRAITALYSAGVFVAGVVGDTLGGVVSDRILHQTGDRNAARRNVLVLGLFGGFLFLMPVMLVHDVDVAALSLAAAFFSVELVVAPIWAVSMDIAPNIQDLQAA